VHPSNSSLAVPRRATEFGSNLGSGGRCLFTGPVKENREGRQALTLGHILPDNVADGRLFEHVQD